MYDFVSPYACALCPQCNSISGEVGSVAFFVPESSARRSGHVTSCPDGAGQQSKMVKNADLQLDFQSLEFEFLLSRWVIDRGKVLKKKLSVPQFPYV